MVVSRRSAYAFIGGLIVLLTSASASAQSTPPQLGRAPFLTPERLEVLPIDDPVALCEPVKVRLKINGYNLTDVLAEETSLPRPSSYMESMRTFSLLNSPEDGTYITILPMRLGQLGVDVMVQFADGGLAHKSILLNVVPDRKQPELLMVGGMGRAHVDVRQIVISSDRSNRLSSMRNVDYLNIYARYKGITEPIEIYPAFATYRILAGGRENPIVLDQQTGLITALKPGEALIETSYAGWHNWTCVDVEEKPVPGNSYYDKNCAGLLPVGEKLGSTR